MKHGKIDQRTMPYLPDEIIEDILKRVPVKSLIRFQCVCNHWKHDIKSQSFIVQHLQQSKNKNPFLVLGCHASYYDTHLLLYLLDSSLKLHELHTCGNHHNLVASCNGLLLIENFDKHYPYPSYSLVNPATKSVTHIPPPHCYACDHICVTGFGFVGEINNFHVGVSNREVPHCLGVRTYKGIE